MAEQIKCTIQGGRMYLTKPDNLRRPITGADVECFAAWKGNKEAASSPDGDYIVEQSEGKWIFRPA